MFLSFLLGAVALLSLVLTLWQWLAARRFPLHQRRAPRIPEPPVTLLKPLKGCDAETVACLRSWLTQKYAGAVQVLFGVGAPDDPVCEVVRRLIAEHPECDIELVLCPKQLGPNPKVSKLAQMEGLARHDILVVSDADVRAPPDLLSQLVVPLQDPGVGLVNCFYELAHPVTFGMRWEALGVNADFWSQVLQSQTLKPLDFALGAVMAAPRAQLAAVGGFNALVDDLADDFQLGHRLARHGARVTICPVVVECWSAPMTWREAWRHQLRWARTIRVCQPAAYFLSILNNGTLWPMLWALACSNPLVWAAAVGCVLVRLGTALDLHRRLTRALDWNCLWLTPVKDILQCTIWALAFLGNKVEWRGEQLRVLRGGKLVRA